MSGSLLGVVFLVLPTAAALQSRLAVPVLVATALGLGLAERARLAALARAAAAFWPLAPLVAWGAASAAWSIAPALSLDAALRFAALLAIGATLPGAATLLAAPARRRAQAGLAAGAAIGAAVLIAEVLGGAWLNAAVRLFPDPPPRVDAVKPGAAVLAVLLPAAVAAARRFGRWAAAGLAALGAVAILAAPSQAARLGLLAAALAAPVGLAPPRLLRRVLPILLALAVLAGPAAVQAAAEAAARAGLLSPSALHRVLIWDFAAARAAERPLLGWGFEASRVMPGGQERVPTAALDRLAAPGPARAALEAMPDRFVHNLPLHPHNGGLQIRLELGLVGLGLAGFAAWRAGAAIAAADPPGRVAGLASTAAALAVGLIAFGVWQSRWVATLLFAAAAWRLVGPAPPPARPHRESGKSPNAPPD